MIGCGFTWKLSRTQVDGFGVRDGAEKNFQLELFSCTACNLNTFYFSTTSFERHTHPHSFMYRISFNALLLHDEEDEVMICRPTKSHVCVCVCVEWAVPVAYANDGIHLFEHGTKARTNYFNFLFGLARNFTWKINYALILTLYALLCILFYWINNLFVANIRAATIGTVWRKLKYADRPVRFIGCTFSKHTHTLKWIPKCLFNLHGLGWNVWALHTRYNINELRECEKQWHCIQNISEIYHYMFCAAHFLHFVGEIRRRYGCWHFLFILIVISRHLSLNYFSWHEYCIDACFLCVLSSSQTNDKFTTDSNCELCPALLICVCHCELGCDEYDEYLLINSIFGSANAEVMRDDNGKCARYFQCILFGAPPSTPSV